MTLKLRRISLDWWNRRAFIRVQLRMDETAAWHLALWQLEMDAHYRDQGQEPPGQ